MGKPIDCGRFLYISALSFTLVWFIHAVVRFIITFFNVGRKNISERAKEGRSVDYNLSASETIEGLTSQQKGESLFCCQRAADSTPMLHKFLFKRTWTGRS
jgi:hypothetical protein